MALIEKVAALREQLCVAAGGGSISDDVQSIAKALGVWDKVKGKPLLEKVNDCYSVVFADAKPQFADAKPQVVVTGQPVASASAGNVVVAGKMVVVEPTKSTKPKDLRLGSTPSHGSPASNNALNTELNNVARNTNDTGRARDLVAAGAQLSSTNGPHWRHTPLHQACYHGRYEMAKVLLELGADTSLHSNPCGRGKHGTPLELAHGGKHKRIVEMLLSQGSPSSATTSTTDAAPAARAGPPAEDKFAGERLWDKSLHANGGPHDAQPILPIQTICCAAPFLICPLHCLSAWGCDGAVGMLTSAPCCTHVWCAPCSPNSKNPLWCCAEPLGWASSFGQLHTVMSLVANGAKPHTRNLAGENAFTDATRERHMHVVEWLKAWERAGTPAAPGCSSMRREKRETAEGAQV